MTSEENASQVPLEEREILEIERLKHYYVQTIEAAAVFIVFVKQFGPLHNYSILSLWHMQCCTGMWSHEDATAV